MNRINILSYKNTWAFLLSSVMLVSSCTNDFEEINTDKNAVMTIGQAELPYLFSKALSSVPWNGQTAQNLYSDQYAQYFANVSSSFGSDRYSINHSWLNDPWNLQYTEVVPQLNTLFENTDPASAEHALAKLWWVYSFHRITDYWGPIPYFKAGMPGLTVAYDAQEDIYNDFFIKLDEVLEVLEGKTGETPYGSFDIIYNGNVPKWIKFANTLRLRLAMRLSKVDPDRAKIEAEKAVADGVFTTSPDDDALALKHLNDVNDISQMSEWNEFRMSAAMESALVGYDDPRISEYFIPAKNTGTYEGLRNGLLSTELSLPENTAAANSHVGPRWTSPASGGITNYLTTPANVMATAEAYFLRAEGALYGWEMGGTAKELYEAGIRHSMYQWGITDDAVITDYINSAATPIAPDDFLDSPPISDVPVKFDDADEDVQLEQIFIQKWLGLFPDGWEAWSDSRRLSVNPFYPVANSDNPDIPDPTQQWIQRVPFLVNEKNTNGEEVKKAIELLGGEDKITTKLWWDKD